MTLTALVGAVVAGMLTVLAPCAVSLLPVVVGGALQGGAPSAAWDRGWRRAVVVALALGASFVAFTLLLKASTALIGIPPRVWQILSGGLLILLGIAAAFPALWDAVASHTGLSPRSGPALAQANSRKGVVGALLTGAALGPVFTSCSPLYGYVIVTVLPAEPARGLLLLVAYVTGLVAVLLAVSLAGQQLVRRLRWASNPEAAWRRGLGVLFVVVGVLVATGAMQRIETWLLDYAPWLRGGA